MEIFTENVEKINKWNCDVTEMEMYAAKTEQKIATEIAPTKSKIQWYAEHRTA